MGCGFAVGLLGLALVTGTVMGSLPSLAAPVRLSLAATAASTQMTAEAVGDPTDSAASTSGWPVIEAATAPPGASPTVSPPNPWVANIPEAACIPTDIPQTGRVVEVVDAQTIRVLMDRDQRVYAVRYIGIELPQSLNEPFTLNAILHNKELAYGKKATLVRDITDQDNFGRLLRYVMIGRTFVNYELIAGGYARVKPSPPDTACYTAFQVAEGQARSNELGIWSISAPTP
jgi:endonuclease YncB( thermonuclease family)